MKNSILTLIILLSSVCATAQSVAVTFEVNMSYQIKQGKFNPETEFVDIAGNFNGWGGTLNKLSDANGDSIWSVSINLASGSSIEFKFRYNGQWDDREEFPGAGNNRTYTVGEVDETLTFWYNDEEPPTGPAIAGIASSSNFTFANGSILFTEDGSGLIESYEWTFEGGSPSASNDRSVSVSYSTPGTYDVKLKVSNSFSEDEILLEDYITVEERSTDDLNWWNETVFYEIFVRSFYDSDGDGIGDFQGIIEKLDYLNDGDPTTNSDLGITGIWLMPIHDSPSYHGYDVNDYRSINPDYGTMDDFKEFLAEAHKRGIKVIIDLVLNHSSTEIEWFQNARSSKSSEKRNWYRWSDTQPNYSGPWGQGVWHGSSTGFYYGLFWGGMPDLNYDEPKLKEEMFDITQFWLEDIGIDGYRLDAVKYIKEEGSVLEDLDSTHDFWREWVAITKESNPDAFSVGEAWTSTEKIVPYVVNDGLDMCFDFDLGNAILGSVKSRNATGLKSQVSKVINSYPYYQFGTFTTNHDMTRIMDEFGSDEEKVKLAAVVYLTLPGTPFIYYGEEIGMTGRKPDENIRRPMAWSAESHAGFSSTNPWNQPSSNFLTNNVAVQKVEAASLFNWYRKLVQLRNSSKALQIGEYSQINIEDESIYGFERVEQGERVMTLVNFSSSEKSVSIDVSAYDQVGDEPALVDMLGTDRIDILNKSTIEVILPANSAKVLAVGNLTLNTKENPIEVDVFPNPSDEKLHIKARGSFEFEFLTISGQKLRGGSGNDSLDIDMHLFDAGIYLLKMEIDGRQILKKIIKK